MHSLPVAACLAIGSFRGAPLLVAHPPLGLVRLPPLQLGAGNPLALHMSAAAATLPQHADRPLRGLERVRLSGKLNAFGVIFALNCLVWGAILLLPMCLLALLDPRRRLVSRVGNVWGRLVLRSTGIPATVEGRDKLPPADEAVMYVANHCSYLDIPITGLLCRPVKYISKAEAKRIPIIGLKLGLAKDLVLARGDRRSEARLLVDAVRALKDGESVLAFPEGTTTPNGRLLPFKRGAFKMAVSAGVRVVPLTILGTFDAWPRQSLAPQRQVPLSLRVHDPIAAKGRSEDEVCELARAAVESGLPRDSATPDPLSD